MKEVIVIGAGLAGCEAAYQLAKRGVRVKLYEMKPQKMSPAHSNNGFAELVCSNSLRSDDIQNAVGLLKEEMRMLDSLIMKCAEKARVPAGSALAVDREIFSKLVTNEINSLENVEVISEEVLEIDASKPTIIASGPLTSNALSESIQKLLGEDYLHFFDAAAPIVTRESIDFESAFCADRYGKGDSDYVNCPLSKDEYLDFHKELISAETVKLKEFENNNVFEGCMPIEVMALRGDKTMRFGPMKPIGLIDPKENRKPYAVLQLRKEDLEGTMFNLVGFQTHLTFKEQKRVFSLIPALKNAEFVRYGVMHRNTFLNSPKLLNKFYQLKKLPNVFFAGQITGVEGYVESASSGLLVGINMARMLEGNEMVDFSMKTAIGSLAHYVSESVSKNFQPMNVNFSIVEELSEQIRDKQIKRQKLAERAVERIKEIKKEM